MAMTGMFSTDANSKRRSFLHERLQQLGARFEDIGAGVLAAVEITPTAPSANNLHLADLSPLPRVGYKGSGAPAWLRQQGLTLPAQPNTATTQTDGVIVAALSAQEHLLLSPPLTSPPTALDNITATWSLDSAANCYQLPRIDSHCWLALCGAPASDMLAKLCGVDLRPASFAAGAVAQTSLARLNAIVLRQPLSNTEASADTFHLFTDIASVEYLWDCLLDAMGEYDGTIVGLNALRALSIAVNGAD